MDTKHKAVKVEVTYKYTFVLDDMGEHFEGDDITEEQVKQSLVYDALESISNGGGGDGDTVKVTIVDTRDPEEPEPVLVAWDDIVESFLLAMHAEGLDHDTRARIVTTVRDAVDNNS